MFDYKLLSALTTVVEQGGFERAAQLLGLSQSAVSQRIKLLEARLGEPVLIRGTPPQPTELGLRLLSHVQHVRLLERDLQSQVPALDDGQRVERLRVALNADSLSTWWVDAVSGFCNRHKLLLELVVEDQDVGLRRMRQGEVAACLCASARPVAGARSLALGSMRYLAVASQAFMAQHGGARFEVARMASLPAIVFGPDDQLQHRYLQHFGLAGPINHHLCPSSEGFVQMVSAGMGWGMLPEQQARPLLQQGLLQELVPSVAVDVPLFWHYWRNGGQLLTALTDHLALQASRSLVAVDGLSDTPEPDGGWQGQPQPT